MADTVSLRATTAQAISDTVLRERANAGGVTTYTRLFVALLDDRVEVALLSIDAFSPTGSCLRPLRSYSGAVRRITHSAPD